MGRDSLSIRPASGDEFDIVIGLLKQRVEWLRERGSDQWSTWESWRSKMRPSILAGDVWLMFDDRDPVGTITVEFCADRDFWTEAEAAEPAAYISKLAVRPDRAGAELGALLLNWAAEYAGRRGCRYVRLDAWKTNTRLHAYYRERGWTYLRTVDQPGRRSGALFQRPTHPLAEERRGQFTFLSAATDQGQQRRHPQIDLERMFTELAAKQHLIMGLFAEA